MNDFEKILKAEYAKFLAANGKSPLPQSKPKTIQKADSSKSANKKQNDKPSRGGNIDLSA
jgi:hypothetical protein